MKFKPSIKLMSDAQQRGRDAFNAGKSIEDNPYLVDSMIALSSWWKAGFLKEKSKG